MRAEVLEYDRLMPTGENSDCGRAAPLHSYLSWFPCWTHQPEVRAPFQGRGGRKGRRNGPPSSQVLFLVYKVTAPVLLPALLVRLGAERFLLAVADRLDSAGIDSRRGQGVLYGIGTIVTQGQVVFRRAALVTVSLNREVDVGMLSQELRARLNG